MEELDLKRQRIADLLNEKELDAVLLQRSDNFAWATCGAASHINIASTTGVASLMISPSGYYLITDNIEAPRLEQEECLRDQGWDFRIAPWYQPNEAIAELTRGLRLGADVARPGATDVSADLGQLRMALTPQEDVRFRDLGQRCAAAMNAAARAAVPGMTEHEIAARLDEEARSRGVDPTVNLIASDDRIFSFRHPLPTDKRVERYVMLVLCGRKWGLVCSITRLVHFGPLPDELRRKQDAVSRIDGCFIAATRSGRRLSDVFGDAVTEYRLQGFPDEWRLHHQGGIAGYQPREVVATPSTGTEVQVGQAYAWNPSIAGMKSEDTILVGPQVNEIITTIPDWPMLRVQRDGQTWDRPAVLEVG